MLLRLAERLRHEGAWTPVVAPALLNATLAPDAHPCDWCCTVYYYAIPLGGGWTLPVVGFALALIQFALLCALLARMAVLYKHSLEKGYTYYNYPITAMRERRDHTAATPDSVWILPWYHGYLLALALFLALQIILAFPSDGPVFMWLNRLVCGLCESLDMMLVFFLCLPYITPVRTVVLALFAIAWCGIIVGFVLLTHQDIVLPYTNFNYPTTSIAYVYLGEAALCAAIALLAWFRPLKHNPRPAAVVICVFWIPLYVACAVLIPMEAGYRAYNPVDWGYCILLCCACYYSLAFIPVFYVTLKRDSLWVLQHRLHSSMQQRASAVHVQQDDEAATLLQQSSSNNAELVEVLGDSSVARIASRELQLLQRVGRGSYGTVWRATWNGREARYLVRCAHAHSPLGAVVAVKQLQELEDATEGAESRQRHEILQEFGSEVRLLARLRHPNCLLLVGLVLERGNLALVSEYCAKGSLWHVLHRHDPALNTACRMEIGAAAVVLFPLVLSSLTPVMQMAAALEYLHASSVVHRDLKSPNVLLTDAMQVRIADCELEGGGCMGVAHSPCFDSWHVAASPGDCAHHDRPGHGGMERA